MRELEKELEDLPENFIVGVVMPSDNYEAVNLHLLSHLINRKKASGSYVSVSKPMDVMTKTQQSLYPHSLRNSNRPR